MRAPSQNMLEHIKSGILSEDDESEKHDYKESIAGWGDSPNNKPSNNNDAVKVSQSEKPTSSAGQKNYHQFLKYMAPKANIPASK